MELRITVMSFSVALRYAQSIAWEPLFDGRTPAGWRTQSRDAFPSQAWRIEDGCLRSVAAAPRVDLSTARLFRNFDAGRMRAHPGRRWPAGAPRCAHPIGSGERIYRRADVATTWQHALVHQGTVPKPARRRRGPEATPDAARKTAPQDCATGSGAECVLSSPYQSMVRIVK